MWRACIVQHPIVLAATGFPRLAKGRSMA